MAYATLITGLINHSKRGNRTTISSGPPKADASEIRNAINTNYER